VSSALLNGSETWRSTKLLIKLFKEDPEYPLARGHLKRRTIGKEKSTSREERGNGSGIRYGSLRITSLVPPSRVQKKRPPKAIREEAECARRVRQEEQRTC